MRRVGFEIKGWKINVKGNVCDAMKSSQAISYVHVVYGL
jgi:hypothetical protein